jgi:hypothetical protein
MKDILSKVFADTCVSDGTVIGRRPVKFISSDDSGKVIVGLATAGSDNILGIAEFTPLNFEQGTDLSVYRTTAVVSCVVDAATASISAGTKLTAGANGLVAAGDNDKVFGTCYATHTQGQERIAVLLNCL